MLPQQQQGPSSSSSVNNPVLQKEHMRLIAESVGVSLVGNDTLLNMLAHEAESRLRDVIQEAHKFAVRSKHPDLLTTTDINSVLKLHGIQTLFGYSRKAPMGFQRIAPVFIPDDPEVDFEELSKQPLPPIPQDILLKLHWFSIDGSVPNIPQNAPQPETAAAAAGGSAAAGAQQGGVKRPRTDDGVEVKNPVKHQLPKEMQLLFETVMAGLMSRNETAINQAIETIGTDLSMSQLTPYIISRIAIELGKHLGDLPVLFPLIRATRALILSPASSSVENYLHVFNAAVVTCMLAKRIGAPEEDHWALRDFAAGTLSEMCHRYKTYHTVEPRLARTLFTALKDSSKALPTHYGAILGITALGPAAIHRLIFPHIKEWHDRLLPIIQADPDPFHQMEARRVAAALFEAAKKYMQEAREGDTPEMHTFRGEDVVEVYRTLHEIFGEAIEPFRPKSPGMTEDPAVVPMDQDHF